MPKNLINISEGKMNYGVNNREDRLKKRITEFLYSRKKELTINISNLNFLEASRMALLNSTKCYVENPEKKLNWIVKDEGIKSLLIPFKLNNMEILTK